MPFLLFIAFFLLKPAIASELASIGERSLSSDEYLRAVSALGEDASKVKDNSLVKRKFLDHLIDTELLAEEAKKSQLHQSKEFLERKKVLEKDLLAKIYLEKAIKQGTDRQKLYLYYQKNSHTLSHQKVRASHILMDASQRSLAQQVLKRALKGEDFSALAKAYSKGPTKSTGGDLDYFKKGQMVPAFEKAAFATPKNQIHPHLVETRFGLHIIKVTDIQSTPPPSFEQSLPRLKEQRSKEIKEELTAKLRQKHEVEIDEEALQSLRL